MARQEKSLAVCLEILQDYTAKAFSYFAVLTTADFCSHNSQFHFYRTIQTTGNSGTPPFPVSVVWHEEKCSFCRLQANRLKETPFLDLPYHLFCLIHRMKEVIAVNINDHFHACLHSLGENPI